LTFSWNVKHPFEGAAGGGLTTDPAVSESVRVSTASRDWRADPAGSTFDESRSAILDAAEHVINESGLDGFRITQVAERAGCTRQNVHRYFPTKRDLTAAVMYRRTQRLGRGVTRDLPADAHPIDRLVHGIIAAVDVTLADAHLGSYYADRSAAEMLMFVTASPGVRSAITRMARPLMDALRDSNPSLDEEDIADWLLRLYVAEMVWSIGSDRSTDERVKGLRLLALSPFSGLGGTTSG
jgi:AcrR family transcriptional regulator